MGYRRALLGRWSQRDRLAVAVIALTVAFLVGATLLGLAVGEQTTGLAAEYGTTTAVSYHPTPVTAAPGTTVLPASQLHEEGVYLLGIPAPPPTVAGRGQTVTLPSTTQGEVTVGTVDQATTRTLTTRTGQQQLQITPRGPNPVVADTWYVSAPSTVQQLGADGAFVLSDTAVSPAQPRPGTAPIISVLAFFIQGTESIVRLIGLATAASSVLVLVTVYGVTAITVDDRRRTIDIVRATGGSAYQLLGLFALRAGLLTAIGVGVGYAIGLILSRLVVNTAIFLGLTTSLNLSLGATAVRIIAPSGLAIMCVGGIAGAIAAWPAVTGPPFDQPQLTAETATGSLQTRISSLFKLKVLTWEALIPTTATLTVFVSFVLLASALSAVAAPVAAPDEQTITQPDTPHPVASSVPEVYAPTLRNQGVAASPEILLFEVSGGDPFLARGVNYTAYSEFADTKLVRGRAPAGPNEAVIGADLAPVLNVGVGDSVTLGGSTAPAFTRVDVVGVARGPGLTDDQLLVSLPTARHLSATDEGLVQYIRVKGLTDQPPGTATTAVTDVNARLTADATILSVEVQNYGLSTAESTFEIRFAGQTRTVTVTVPAGRQTTAEVAFPPQQPDSYPVTVGEFNQTIQVGGSRLELQQLPDQVPPETPLRVQVTGASGPVENATITIGNRTVATDGNGQATVVFSRVGTQEVRIQTAAGQRQTEVTVSTDAPRQLTVDSQISPSTPTITTRPTITVVITNPWETPLTQRVELRGPNTAVTRTVTLAPGARTTVQTTLPQRPAGRYETQILLNGTVTDTRSYEVQGDDRLAAAIVSSGRQQTGSGIGQAIEVMFGNLSILLGGLLLLAGVMTVGGTAASFTRAVVARRQTLGIRRATGATPRQIVWTVVSDAAVVGGVATLGAMILASSLVTASLAIGELRLFGIALQPTFSPRIFLLAGGLTMAIVLMSAGVAASMLLRDSPAAILGGRSSRMIQDAAGRRGNEP